MSNDQTKLTFLTLFHTDLSKDYVTIKKVHIRIFSKRLVTHFES